MKKILLIAMALATVGCRKAENVSQDQVEVSENNQGSGLSWVNDAKSIFRDDETGCQYIVQSEGIAARLDSDGRPICTTDSEGEDQ